MLLFTAFCIPAVSGPGWHTWIIAQKVCLCLRLAIPGQDHKLSQHNPSPALRLSEVVRVSILRSLPRMLDDLHGIASGTLRIP